MIEAVGAVPGIHFATSISTAWPICHVDLHSMMNYSGNTGYVIISVILSSTRDTGINLMVASVAGHKEVNPGVNQQGP